MFRSDLVLKITICECCGTMFRMFGLGSITFRLHWKFDMKLAFRSVDVR